MELSYLHKKILEWIPEQVLAWWLTMKIEEELKRGKDKMPIAFRESAEYLVRIWKDPEINPVFTEQEFAYSEVLTANRKGFKNLTVEGKHNAQRAAIAILNSSVGDLDSHLYEKGDALDRFLKEVFPDPEFYKKQH